MIADEKSHGAVLNQGSTTMCVCNKSNCQKTGQVPTVAGAVPARLGQRVEAATAGNVAEFSRLPKPGERCAVSGASRSWLIETDAKLGPDERFLVRVRRRGCLRGTVFVSVPKLVAFISKAAAGEVAGFASEVSSERKPELESAVKEFKPDLVVFWPQTKVEAAGEETK